VIGKPLIWVHEGVMLGFIWITMLGAAAALKSNEHIKIDTFLSYLPQRAARIVALVVALLILLTLVVIAYQLPRAIQVQNRSVTSSLPINIPRGFYYSLPVLVGVLSMIATQIYHVVGRARELLGLPGTYNDYSGDGTGEL
jgi:TRAP-type C4-dicarboxylate transport system permease small subunit